MKLPDRFHPGRHRRPVEIAPELMDARAEDALLSSNDLDDEGAAVPDLTNKVMGRLGYMQAAPAVAARRRRQRWINRGLLSCVVCLFGAGVVLVMPRVPGARGPEATTMPAAVGQSIGQRHEHADRTFELIRGLIDAPAEQAPDVSAEGVIVEPPPSDEIAPDVDRSAIAEVRWL